MCAYMCAGVAYNMNLKLYFNFYKVVFLVGYHAIERSETVDNQQQDALC